LIVFPLLCTSQYSSLSNPVVTVAPCVSDMLLYSPARNHCFIQLTVCDRVLWSCQQRNIVCTKTYVEKVLLMTSWL